MKKEIILMLITICAMFIGCSDTGVSADDYTDMRCDYTIHYYHPNIDEVISLYATASDYYEMSCFDGAWCLKDMYSRTISNDTVVYKNELWTEEELNEHLGNNLPATANDSLTAHFSGDNIVPAMLNELNKRKGELLNVNCYEAKYVTGANNE